MRISPRIGAAGLAFAFAMMLAAWPVSAQELGTGKSSPRAGDPSVKPKFDPSRRVPDFFGQIGLTGEQRETIYKIRAKHYQEIDEVEKQIAVIQARMLAECESVLNDNQKQLLEHRRRSAAQGKRAPEVTKPARSSN
jgi:hypothetical protein